MSIKHRVFQNVSWLFIDKIIRIFGGLLILVWVARYLGPTDYGMLNFALAYAALFSVFVSFGFDQILVREIVKKPKLTNFFLGTAFGLKFLGSIVSIILIWISLNFSDVDQITKLIILVISCGFVFQSIDIIDFFYQSQVLSRYVVIARSGAFILGVFLRAFLIIYGYDVFYFAMAVTFELALSSLFLILVYKKTHHAMRQWKFSTRIAKQLFLHAWPLALSVFLISIHMKIDQVMLGNMLNQEQVGIYSVAVRLAESWVFIPAIIMSTLMPHFVNLRESNYELYEFRLMQLYSVMFWMGLIIGVVIIFFGADLIRVLFGVAYIDAYEALVYNIWTGTLMSLGMARGIWMISENLQKYRLYNNIIGVAVNVSLNLVLIPVLGITGAAIATLVQQAMGLFVFSYIWKPFRRSTTAIIKSINPVYLFSLRQSL